jgi:hypothetical protein
MILNAYAVLDFSLSLLRLLLALGIVGLGGLAWFRRSPTPDAKKDLEDRSYLLFLMAILLLGLNLLSWPLLYLLLQSYVSEWPGVMCVYGVTRIGTDCVGPSRFLPGLLQFLQLAKPALAFVSGLWFVLYLVNRQTATAPLSHRILAVLVLAGLIAVGDAAAELIYLEIPKKEDFSSGCCAPTSQDASHGTWLVPNAVVSVRDRPLLTAGYYSVTAAVILGVISSLTQARQQQHVPRLWPLVVGALVALSIATVFLVEVEAPVLLRLPYHHCPYDLLPRVPEAVLGMALFLGGTFCVGWAWLTGWWGNCEESRPFLHETIATILLVGLFCYLGSMVLTTVGLALA